MPELIEVEQYREALDVLCGETVRSVDIPDSAFVRPREAPLEVFDALVGRTLASTSRHGKLLLAHFGTKDDYVVGMRFGMTGRLLIDGVSPIETLEYASGRNDPAWDRAILDVGGHRVAMRDQRRLGSIELDPDTRQLGVEASTLTASALSGICTRRTKAIKAVLLDQALVAGLGNLLVDETLWQAGIDPRRSAGALSGHEIDAVAAQAVATVRTLSARGGSHTGDSFELRHLDATCHRCAGSMSHDTVGGRSTWWCATHQS